MSYSVVGYRVKNAIYCNEHAQIEVLRELEIATQEEIDYLLFPAPHDEQQAEWPVRYREDGYKDPYIYDDCGNIIMARHVYVKSDDPIHDHKSDVGAVYDDGTWEDGLHCDTCSAVLIEPYGVECYLCKETFMEGEAASRVENWYKYSELLCPKCFTSEQQAVRDIIAGKIEARGIEAKTDVEYQHWQKRLGLFIEQKPTKNLFQMMFLGGKKELSYELSSLFDVYALLRGNVSVADELENSVDAQIITLIEETCEESSALLKTPAHEVYAKIQSGESLQQKDVVTLYSAA